MPAKKQKIPRSGKKTMLIEYGGYVADNAKPIKNQPKADQSNAQPAIKSDRLLRKPKATN